MYAGHSCGILYFTRVFTFSKSISGGDTPDITLRTSRTSIRFGGYIEMHNIEMCSQDNQLGYKVAYTNSSSFWHPPVIFSASVVRH